MPYPDNRPHIDYHGYFTGALTRLHAERRYRVFADLERIAGRFPHAVWHSPQGPKTVVIWCSKLRPVTIRSILPLFGYPPRRDSDQK